MASNNNSIQLQLTNVTVGVSAVALNTSALQVSKFTVSNPNTGSLFIGDSTVSSTKYTAKLSAGSNITFGETKIIQNQTSTYDLANIFVRATAAAQVATLTTYVKALTGGAF